MKKLLSTNYSAGALNAALLFLRLIAGGSIMKHGYGKLVDFSEYKTEFLNFLGMGSTLSLVLAIFAEFFCGLFIILGLFTRLSAAILVITMGVIIFRVLNADIFDKAELPLLYLGAYLTLMLVGPGKVSVDGMSGR